MPCTLLKTYLFLAFILVAQARPQSVPLVNTGPFAIGATNDWASSGNYHIYGCASRVPEVQSILDQTYLALQTAILSTDSPAYAAFFHSAAPSSVTAVLKTITLGTNLTTVTRKSRRPTLACVNEVDDRIRAFWKACQQSENIFVIETLGTAILWLCPVFFDLEPLPLSTDCGAVNRASTKLITQNLIEQTQYHFLVQGLARMYIGEARGLGATAQGRIVRDENACLALPPDQALTNPSSFAFYASSKWFAFRQSLRRDLEREGR